MERCAILSKLSRAVTTPLSKNSSQIKGRCCGVSFTDCVRSQPARAPGIAVELFYRLREISACSGGRAPGAPESQGIQKGMEGGISCRLPN